MKASRLTTVLENLLDQPWAAFIWGAPGIGKSSIVRQIAERRRMPLIDILKVVQNRHDTQVKMTF